MAWGTIGGYADSNGPTAQPEQAKVDTKAKTPGRGTHAGINRAATKPGQGYQARSVAPARGRPTSETGSREAVASSTPKPTGGLATSPYKDWSVAAEPLLACKTFDIGPLVPTLNKIKIAATKGNVGAIKAGVAEAENKALKAEKITPETGDNDSVSHYHKSVQNMRYCVGGLFNQPNNLKVQEAISNAEFEHVTHDLLQLNLAVKGRLDHSPADLKELRRIIIKNGSSKLANYAVDLINRAMSLVQRELPDGSSPSPNQMKFQLAQLVKALITPSRDNIDPNLLALVVFKCGEAINGSPRDDTDLTVLRGELKGIVMGEVMATQRDNVGYWINYWLEPIDTLIDAKMDNTDDEDDETKIIVMKSPPGVIAEGGPDVQYVSIGNEYEDDKDTETKTIVMKSPPGVIAAGGPKVQYVDVRVPLGRSDNIAAPKPKGTEAQFTETASITSKLMKLGMDDETIERLSVVASANGFTLENFINTFKADSPIHYVAKGLLDGHFLPAKLQAWMPKINELMNSPPDIIDSTEKMLASNNQ